ncbi:MAG: aspartyl/asparaginyl beta-hydroxylase domain-containing protein [Alphaproteobacteria bacterium]|nr:aspartyl/asparaginyl beta-hydroxylase domain-containing protein [Alphaproteobacteria bacterium]
MADATAETPKPQKPPKPKTLKGPVRRRVKRYGKRLTRWVAAYQARQSLVPDTPFVGNEHFPFLKEFEDRWQEIQTEAREVLKFREHIPGFQDVSPDQYRISVADNWKTFFLYGFGNRVETNCKQAPVTAEIIGRAPEIHTAFFSILAPGFHIPAHTGVTKGILRTHLGLIIPKEREKCRIRVGDQFMNWKAGKVFVIDDFYDHEVWNDSDEERVVLLLDFNRPMRLGGRLVNWLLLKAIKQTAFYQEPKKNIRDFEARFEAAARRANENLEKLSDL